MFDVAKLSLAAVLVESTTAILVSCVTGTATYAFVLVAYPNATVPKDALIGAVGTSPVME